MVDSSSSIEEVEAQYDDSVGYRAANSAAMAANLVEAGGILIRRYHSASTRGQVSFARDVSQIEKAVQEAQSWYDKHPDGGRRRSVRNRVVNMRFSRI